MSLIAAPESTNSPDSMSRYTHAERLFLQPALRAIVTVKRPPAAGCFDDDDDEGHYTAGRANSCKSPTN